MATSKAKFILMGQIRKLKSKAYQKRREADRLDAQAEEVQKELDKLDKNV